MKTYEWIIFDADETLFHFDAFRGLKLMFSRLNMKFTHQVYETYQALNKALFIKYQNAAISSEELQYQRFSAWAEKLNMEPADLNKAFLNAMADICSPIEESMLA